MKKYLFILFLFGFLLTPALSFATPPDVSLPGDIDPNPVSSCVNIINNLRYRDRDSSKNGEVSTLQDFLQSKKYLNNEPTGYFGILTFQAVKDFQKANFINPTGYVGTITKDKIKSLTCDNLISPIIPSITVLTPNNVDTFKIGNTYQILWKSEGLKLDEEIYIDLVKPAGTIAGGDGMLSVYEIGKAVKNNGKLSWTIPATIPTVDDQGKSITYKIRVERTGADVEDLSDKYFSITTKIFKSQF